ncbi:MAG: tetratricopeptide repeat protein [Acidobacteria bacterium]|nr:tetratricopeptide repeat protein [Acidobacteriota bacterium]
MKTRSIRLFILSIIATVSLCPVARAVSEASGVGWTGVRSRHFLVLGQAGEGEARRVAMGLEQYRAAFARLLPVEHFDPSVPTIVIVFRDDLEYAPFKPLYRGQTASGVAGYFQPGDEVNYITLAADGEGARRGPSSTLLHEYTHLLVNNYFRLAPLWLAEGLAEYYSTARLSDDKKRLTLGRPVKQRAQALSLQPLLPLAELFAINNESPQYFEQAKRGLFYAQSWALVHYLLNGGGGARRGQLARYLALLSEGTPDREAFRQAFETDLEGMAAELSTYVRRAGYLARDENFERPLDFDAELRAQPLSEADALAHLGDLLLQSRRPEEAEVCLRRALERDPAHAAAHISLGILRLRQNRLEEARQHLGKAISADPQNHLALYHYADVLQREGLGMDLSDVSVRGFEEKTRLIRAALRRAIELAPSFLESYRLLATVELERGLGPEEAEALLRHALALAPRRHELTLLLAQTRSDKGEFAAARELAENAARQGSDPVVREQARKVLALIAVREERAARLKTQAEEEARLAASTRVATQPCDMPDPGPQYKKLRFDGEQVCGQLKSIECEDEGVVLLIEAGGRSLRLRAEAFNLVRFVTYTTAVKGRVACGARDPAVLVLVTYRRRKDGKTEFDGVPVAVEFIPQEWER